MDVLFPPVAEAMRHDDCGLVVLERRHDECMFACHAQPNGPPTGTVEDAGEVSLKCRETESVKDTSLRSADGVVRSSSAGSDQAQWLFRRSRVKLVRGDSNSRTQLGSLASD